MRPDAGSKRSARGFTLIELLITVAIIGLLTAILMPIFQEAIQKAKQKGTMADIHSLTKAIMMYVSDHGRAPANPNGALQGGGPFLADLDALHISNVPITDQWGFPLRVWTGAAVAGHFGISSSDVGSDDFLVQSMGQDGVDEGFVYSATTPFDYYAVGAVADFKKDLIMWNGAWIHAPRSAQSGS
jgi:prepilin-type N-terminal cleavage/methylation domain-containing protein